MAASAALVGREPGGLFVANPVAVPNSGGWTLADAARSIRAEVEADTNAFVAATLNDIDVADREALLDGLLLLDGDDPRPPEDR